MSLATCWHFSVRGLRLVDTNQASCCVKQTTSIIAGLPPSVNSVRASHKAGQGEGKIAPGQLHKKVD